MDGADEPSTSYERYAARVLAAFAESPPPSRIGIHEHRYVTRACQLALVEGERNESSSSPSMLGPIASSHFKRLTLAFGSSKRCEYCRDNDACMVRGCHLTPVGTSTADSAARFRCVPGLHFCNAHGLQILANRQTVVTDNVFALSGGRFAQNVFDGIVPKATRGREPEAARRKRRRRADLALVRTALDERPELGDRTAQQALFALMDDNAPPAPPTESPPDRPLF